MAFLTAPAFLLGLLGVILGALRRRRWAGRLGAVACILTLIGSFLVSMQEGDRPGALAEHLIPGSTLAFWATVALTLLIAVVALILSTAEDPAPPST